MIVIDTHALIWLTNEDERLGQQGRALADVALTENRLWASSITFCEVAYLQRQGRIRIELPVVTWRRDLMQRGLRERALDGTVAIEAALLENFHKDPGDRLIVATTMKVGADLLTADEKILAWSGPLGRIDARL